jgi:hypothetical protein
VLREIKTRFDNVPGLYLKSLEQKDGELTIKGISPSESAVTRFGQSLEFSSGLFTNLNIETQRETIQGSSDNTAAAPSNSIVSVPQPEVVSFTVKCNYAAKSQPQTAGNPASNQVALKVTKRQADPFK